MTLHTIKGVTRDVNGRLFDYSAKLVEESRFDPETCRGSSVIIEAEYIAADGHQATTIDELKVMVGGAS
jgi:hypothetical protein